MTEVIERTCAHTRKGGKCFLLSSRLRRWTTELRAIKQERQKLDTAEVPSGEKLQKHSVGCGARGCPGRAHVDGAEITDPDTEERRGTQMLLSQLQEGEGSRMD